MARWIPVASMMLVSLISYIDRNTLALLIPTIMRDTHLSAEQYGFIVSAFSIAYMIGSPIWGGLLDRLGLRLGMTIAVAFWTAASMAHAVASGFLSFAIARTVLGFGEGATFPGGLRTVMQTLPPQQQARGIGLAYSGGSLGAIVTPIIVTPIFAFWGWRAAFLFTGAIGAAWLAMWLLVSRTPAVQDFKAVSGAALQGADRTGGALHHTAENPHFKDPRLWSFILAYGLGATPLGFVMYAAALYLNQALGKDQMFLGKVLWIPPLGWELGYFFWGWLVDRMTSAGVPKLTTVRRLMFASVFLSLPLAAVPWMSSTALVLLEMFIATFVIVGFVVPAIAYATHVYSPSCSGLIAGIGAGSYGAIVAVTMPLFGRLFDIRRYDLAFAIAALLPAVGYAGWAWINRAAERNVTLEVAASQRAVN
jgi:MFS transporter, ACS family, hexuronate transporter